MAIKKKAQVQGPRVWTVAELGAFYTEHRSELIAHASRILKDRAKAEEVIQDALIKVMLAAPELESADHALGYMHRTIENLCIDIFRIEGRRPNLVVLDDASAELRRQSCLEGRLFAGRRRCFGRHAHARCDGHRVSQRRLLRNAKGGISISIAFMKVPAPTIAESAELHRL